MYVRVRKAGGIHKKKKNLVCWQAHVGNESMSLMWCICIMHVRQPEQLVSHSVLVQLETHSLQKTHVRKTAGRRSRGTADQAQLTVLP